MVIIMQNSDIFEKDRKYIAHTYHRFPAAIKNGHGAQAEDYEGKKYIDFGSGIGTNSLGFCNSKWVQAVVSQVSQLQHTSNLFYTLPDSLLAERLCEVTEYSKVFFGNSGAEANEGAIKVARKYGMKVKGGIATVLLHWKIPFMEGRLQRFPPQVRIYSTSIFSLLQKVFSMSRQTTVMCCMKR